MSREVLAHVVRRVLHEDVFYPAHAPRTESDEYKAVHHKLVVEEDRPCFICNIRNSQLDDPTVNTEGVKELETHHLWVEWALANDVDADKLNAYFNTQLAPEDVGAFVDHDERNLLVLCDRHHRHNEVGIHAITFPIWVAQKFVLPQTDLTVDPAL